MIEWTTETEKRVGRMVQIILTDPYLLAIHQRFGGEVFRRSSVFHELKRFCEDQNVGGEACMEIGTWNGITAVVLSRFFKKVITVDIVNNSVKREIVDHLGIRNIEFIDVADNAEKAAAIDERRFEFAYVDGDHANDTRSDFDLVKRCGQVLFQECLPMQPPVYSLVRSLPPQEVTYGGIGLALWRATK